MLCKKYNDESDVSNRNPWAPVWEGFPLSSLMDMFAKDVNLHRVPVVDKVPYLSVTLISPIHTPRFVFTSILSLSLSTTNGWGMHSQPTAAM